MYKSYQAYADKVKRKKRQGEWLETWDVIVNPENKEEGFAFTLVGCPLADFCDYWYVPDESNTAKSYIGRIF